MAAPGIETVDTLDGVERLRAEGWDDLVRSAPRPSPFLLHGWVMPWLEYRGRGALLAIHVARRDGRLVGALPLVVRRRRGTAVAEFVGGHQAQLADLLLADGSDVDT